MMGSEGVICRSELEPDLDRKACQAPIHSLAMTATLKIGCRLLRADAPATLLHACNLVEVETDRDAWVLSEGDTTGSMDGSMLFSSTHRLFALEIRRVLSFSPQFLCLLRQGSRT